MATRTKNKVENYIESAADAAAELAEAAEAFKISWAHLRRARERGEKAAEPVVRAGKKALRTTKRAISRTASNAKRVMPKRKSKRSKR